MGVIPTHAEGIPNELKFNFDDYSILVIADVKTPPEAREYCNKFLLSGKFYKSILATIFKTKIKNFVNVNFDTKLPWD